jgi:hypothetical protein
LLDEIITLQEEDKDIHTKVISINKPTKNSVSEPNKTIENLENELTIREKNGDIINDENEEKANKN